VNSSGHKILLVEDDNDQLRMLMEMLKWEGYQVILARDGEDAFGKVKKQRPDLVITDLAMPQVSGVELIAKIRQDAETKTLPIIVITAYTWDEIALKAREQGYQALLSKPFELSELRRQIQKLLPPAEPS